MAKGPHSDRGHEREEGRTYQDPELWEPPVTVWSQSLLPLSHAFPTPSLDFGSGGLLILVVASLRPVLHTRGCPDPMFLIQAPSTQITTQKARRGTEEMIKNAHADNSKRRPKNAKVERKQKWLCKHKAWLQQGQWVKWSLPLLSAKLYFVLIFLKR